MNKPIMISEETVSLAWGKALRATAKNDKRPMCVSITGFKDNTIQEIPEIRLSLNNLLKEHKIISVRETSETIFPYEHWSRKSPTLAELTDWYTKRYMPRHQARAKTTGCRTIETYFERLVAYEGFKINNGEMTPRTINQLERILDVREHYRRINSNPSPSKYIAAVYNPSIDNINKSRWFPFPCLQQVGFSFSDKKVTVTGYYTIQFLMKRGYGNYLGLCRLGQFMAKETGLPLARVNCHVGNPRVDWKKGDIAPVLDVITAQEKLIEVQKQAAQKN